MVDVGGLSDCLAGIFEGKADDSILDKYDEVRRAKYSDIIDPVSTSNFRTVFDQDPDQAHEGDVFLKTCNDLAKDPKKSREFQLGANAIQYDFTQHYKIASPSSSDGDKEDVFVEQTHFSKLGARVGVCD